MAKIERIIFQPSKIVNILIRTIGEETGQPRSELINESMLEYFLPFNKILAAETEQLLKKLENDKKITGQELKATLARCILTLREYPIAEYDILDQIFFYFRSGYGSRKKRYDYILVVDPEQDIILHQLNEVLKTIDVDFTLGMREFGERSWYIFNNWSELCSYSDTYLALSTIINCEDIYEDLTVLKTLYLIKELDKKILMCPAEKKGKSYPTNITIDDKYLGLRYEVFTYQTDNGYCALTGDNDFLSEEYHDYTTKLANCPLHYGPYNKEQYDELMSLNLEGQNLLRRLSRQNKNLKK